MKTILTDAEDHRRREAQEWRLAQAAVDPLIRDIHADLARRHEALRRKAGDDADPAAGSAAAAG